MDSPMSVAWTSQETLFSTLTTASSATSFGSNGGLPANPPPTMEFVVEAPVPVQLPVELPPPRLPPVRRSYSGGGNSLLSNAWARRSGIYHDYSDPVIAEAYALDRDDTLSTTGTHGDNGSLYGDKKWLRPRFILKVFKKFKKNLDRVLTRTKSA